MADKYYKNNATGESYIVPEDYDLTDDDKALLASFEEVSEEEFLGQ